jgi:type II secretory ATPase GspE/PulE/Tfp pilus assembly ATPase PilB-like protein
MEQYFVKPFDIPLIQNLLMLLKVADECRNSGYRGRAGSPMKCGTVDKDIRALIRTEADASHICQVGLDNGMNILRISGAFTAC